MALAQKRKALFVVTLAFALVVVSVGAQGAGVLNTSSGGYLVCINSKTKVVTHSGKSSCPKGSKKLVLGAQGAEGIKGATGLSGKDGRDGLDGKTLWNGVKDPENSWGAPGDMFINSVTKTLFGPKDLTTGWPAGVIMVGATGATGATGAVGPSGPGGANGGSGPAGATGAIGPAGATGPAGAAGAGGSSITELFLCDGPDAGTVADEKCKIGMAGPGGGIIFFVDYNDEYSGFNYFEAAPLSCEASKAWSSDTTNSVTSTSGWAGRAVGAGQANTTAMMTSGDTSGAAFYADGLTCGGKSDWFLPSLGELKLMSDNLQGLGGFSNLGYSSSTEYNSGQSLLFNLGLNTFTNVFKSFASLVRPMRAF